jgi:hypothetical protein
MTPTPLHCPTCGANLEFEGELGHPIRCDHCGAWSQLSVEGAMPVGLGRYSPVDAATVKAAVAETLRRRALPPPDDLQLIRLDGVYRTREGRVRKGYGSLPPGLRFGVFRVGVRIAGEGTDWITMDPEVDRLPWPVGAEVPEDDDADGERLHHQVEAAVMDGNTMRRADAPIASWTGGLEILQVPLIQASFRLDIDPDRFVGAPPRTRRYTLTFQPDGALIDADLPKREIELLAPWQKRAIAIAFVAVVCIVLVVLGLSGASLAAMWVALFGG